MDSPGCPLMSLLFQDPIHHLHSLHSLSCVPSVLCSVDYSFSPGLLWLWQSWGGLARDGRRPQAEFVCCYYHNVEWASGFVFWGRHHRVEAPLHQGTSDNSVSYQWVCHWLNGHEFEQALGYGEGQRSLARCSPWCHKESDTTEQLNNNNVSHKYLIMLCLPGFLHCFPLPLLFSLAKSY